jgi:hypothetical protein
MDAICFSTKSWDNDAMKSEEEIRAYITDLKDKAIRRDTLALERMVASLQIATLEWTLDEGKWMDGVVEALRKELHVG